MLIPYREKITLFFDIMEGVKRLKGKLVFKNKGRW